MWKSALRRAIYGSLTTKQKWEVDMPTFIEKLEAKWAEGKYVCVGLDPEFDRLPEELKCYALATKTEEEKAQCLAEHMIRIIAKTCDIAAAFKPNSAFYEHYGAAGWKALARVVAAAKQTGVPVILDAKRGDIGNTNEHYAVMAFDSLGADAITIHPYLGWEANKPFLDRADKGVIVLCRTSNPGAGEFQDYEVAVPPSPMPVYIETPDSKDMQRSLGGDAIHVPLYQRVASHVSDPEIWNYNGNCALVMGATYPEELYKVRRFAPDIPLLIPGIGKQGGDLEKTVMAAGHRFLINSSSGICLSPDPRAAAQLLHEEIQEARAKVGMR